MVINKFDDARPQKDTQYFTQNEDHLKNGIGVVIPFFNEKAYELKSTLKSLYQTMLYLRQHSSKWSNKPFNVCIIQDGWHKADPTMQDYLKEIFSWTYNNDSNEHWSLDLVFEKGNIPQGQSMTVVIEKVATGGGDIDNKNNDNQDGDGGNNSASYFCRGTEIKDDKIDLNGRNRNELPRLNLTLIIKIDNRRKHNSHEWFLGHNGFAEAFQSQYVFCTDAYTLFDQQTMYELVTYLDKHDDCCGVTGRQRAMTRTQQGKKEIEYRLSVEYILRLTQLYDFELAGCVFNPTYSYV